MVDREGNVILPADAVVGLLNLSAAEVVVQGLAFAGGDAGIVSRDDEAGNSAPIQIQDVVIQNTGRGLLSDSRGNVTVRDTTIQEHGVERGGS